MKRKLAAVACVFVLLASLGAVSSPIFTGVLKQGGSNAFVRVGGMLSGLPNVIPVGNVGVGEDDLMTYTIAANTLGANGDTVVFEGTWLTADSVNPKLARIYFATQSCIPGWGEFELGPELISIGSFHVVITRLTASTCVCYTSFNSFEGSGGDDGVIMTGLDFTIPIVFKTTGEATDNDDLVQKSLLGWYHPAN